MMLGLSAKFLANIDHAPLELNGLLLKNPFDTRKALIDRIVGHYTTQVIRQGYKILGSFEFIGSPINLISTLGTGFYDFFYEPAKGIVKSPKEFGIGIAKGTRSLVKNSIFGIFNTATKISGSIGKGVSSLSMDSDYIRERQERNAREKPKHLGEGVLFGVRDFGLGVVKGISGIIEEPIKGAANEGIEGFFKGIGRGVIGAAVKPAVGAIDLATQTTKGICNTTTMWDVRNVDRRRLPRYIGPEGILQVYDKEKAYGASLLLKINSKKYRDDFYLYHEIINEPMQGRLTLIVTRQHILLRKGKELSKVWKMALRDVSPSIEVIPPGIVLHTKKTVSSSSSSSSSSDSSRISIRCSNKEQAERIALHLTKIISDINANAEWPFTR